MVLGNARFKVDEGAKLRLSLRFPTHAHLNHTRCANFKAKTNSNAIFSTAC
jgi:hypothetical protein